jgi:hypothetical protein
VELAWLGVAVLSLIITSAILGYKGRRSWLAVVLSLLLGPVGILVALSLRSAPPTVASKFRRCPFCASRIRREAIVCAHCRRDLPPAA